MSAVFQRIAELASSLGHAELRVLLDLAVRAQTSASWQISASSREMAQSTGLARASVQNAIDSLNERRLLRSDVGSATQSAIHIFLFCGPCGLTSGPLVAQIVGQGGLTTRPGVAQTLSQDGPTTGPVVAQQQGQGGLRVEPVANEESSTCEPRYEENAGGRAESIDSDLDKTIDRLQRARKSDFEEKLFEHARQQMASHHAKFARPGNRQSDLPDDSITAQFLAIAEWPKLEWTLSELAAERKQAGYSYGWYITVALQRIHGISPERLRDLRTRLKSTTRSAELTPAKELPPDRTSHHQFPIKPFRRSPDIERFKQQIRELAAVRSL